MHCWTETDVVMNRLHPRLLELGLRFVQSNHVYWLEKDVTDQGKPNGTVAYGPFPTLEQTEWVLGAIEKYERSKGQWASQSHLTSG